MFLPTGFRFHPTDEELITHYLAPKVAGTGFCATVIGELDLNKIEPWDLPSSTTRVGDEWYFFCMKDRKYPTGSRTNRATDSGHWKATGKDKEIRRRRNLIGMKKTLVFYKGRRAPKVEKTNWVMHEYRLEGNQSNTEQNAWVICRVFCRRSGEKQDMEGGFEDELRSSVPVLPATDHNKNRDRFSSASNPIHVTCFSDGSVGLRGSEELAKPSQKNSIMVPLSLSSNATSNLVDLHHQGDGSVQLSESYGHGNDESLKMEEEEEAALGISEETGLITNIETDILTSIRSNFDYQELLPDAERLDVLLWDY